MFSLIINIIILQFIIFGGSTATNDELMGLNWGKVGINPNFKTTYARAEKYCAQRNSRLITSFLLQHDFLHKIFFEHFNRKKS